MKADPPKTKRRFHWRKLFQFRLLTLLIMFAVIAAGFAWLRVTANEATRQREVVEELAMAYETVSIEELKASGEWQNIIEQHQALIESQGFRYVELTEPNSTLAFLDTGYLALAVRYPASNR